MSSVRAAQRRSTRAYGLIQVPRVCRSVKHVPLSTDRGLTLTTWILVANRLPFLGAFDRERNMVASTLLGLFALVPVIRYMRAPRSLLMSGLAGWAIFSFVYRLLCLYFSMLSTIRTPTQVLMIGVLFYLIAATVAWLGAVIWNVRKTHRRGTRTPSS